jgi:hypothetical protein
MTEQRREMTLDEAREWMKTLPWRAVKTDPWSEQRDQYGCGRGERRDYLPRTGPLSDLKLHRHTLRRQNGARRSVEQ